MSRRHADVVHPLFTRRTGTTVEYLLYRHEHWRGEDGSPALALPAKKIATALWTTTPSRAGVRSALDRLLIGELGLPGSQQLAGQVLHRVGHLMVSPTQAVPTTYAVTPVLFQLDSAGGRAASRALDGIWLTREAALGLPQLSATARRVFEELDRGLGEAPATEQVDSLQSCLIAARHGDARLFWDAFAEWRPEFTRRLRRGTKTAVLGRDPDSVEEALQEAGRNIARSISQFDPLLGDAEAWCWTIVRNCAISLLRKKGRHSTSSLEGEDGRTHDVTDYRLDDPAEAAIVAEVKGRIEERLRTRLKADPTLARIWELGQEHGVSHTEIGEQVGIPRATVAVRLHRLRHELRSL